MEQISMLMQMFAQQTSLPLTGSQKEEDSSFAEMLGQKQDSVRADQEQPAEKPAQKPADDKTEPQQSTPATEPGKEQTPAPEEQPMDVAQQLLAAMLLTPQAATQQAPDAQMDGMQTVQTAVQPLADLQNPGIVQQTVPQTATQTVTPQQQVAAQQTAAFSTAQQDVQQTPQQAMQAPQPQAGEAPSVQPTQQNQTAQQNETGLSQRQTTQQSNVQQNADAPKVAVSVQEQPVFQNVEAMPVKVGEAAPTVDTQAANVAEQLTDTVQATLKEVGDTVKIQLMPEHLGQITIELTQQAGKMALVIHAESAKTASLLAQHAGAMGAMVEDRTGQVVQVQVQQPEHQQPQYDGHNQQQQEQEQRQPQPQQQSKEEQDSFLGQLRLGLFALQTTERT